MFLKRRFILDLMFVYKYYICYLLLLILNTFVIYNCLDNFKKLFYK